METKTPGDIIKDLRVEYERHFGEPHSNKPYGTQSGNIKALANVVGSKNVIDTWVFLLKCEDEWFKTKKNIHSLIRWYDELQGMRLQVHGGKKGSLEEKLLDSTLKERAKHAAFRKEMLNE